MTAPKPKMRLTQKLMIAGVCIAVLGLVFTGVGKLLSGSTPEGKFVKQTHSIMPGRTDAERKQIGHNVCSALDSGSTAVSIATTLSSQNSLTATQAAEFLGDSVVAFCPENKSKVHA